MERGKSLFRSMQVLLVALAIMGLIAPVSTSHAVPIPPLGDPLRLVGDPLQFFTGNAAAPGVGAVVNFAVLPPGSAFNGLLSNYYTPSSGSPVFNDTRYTYLYQVANTSTSTLNNFTLPKTGPFPGGVCLGVPRECGHGAFSTGSFTSGNVRLDFLNNGALVNAQGNNLQGAGSFGIAAGLGYKSLTVTASPFGARDVSWQFQS